MKKVLSIVIALGLLMPFSLCAFATDLSDGVYEVPVTLMHKEDEKESFGNKYVAQTALLEIENGKKTVTILLATDMKGIEFSYYTNGSLSGDVAKGETVSDVKVAGETYGQGFEIPVMTDGDIGLQFSVPVMPMSPSARLRIDYSKAVMVSDTQITTTLPTTESSTVPATELSTVISATTEATTQPTIAETTTPTTQSTITYEATTVYVNETVNEKSDSDGTPSFVFVLLFIGATVGLILLLTYDDSKEKTKNDD